MYKRILVPLDGSPLADQILPHVVKLATAMSLKVILVRVTPAAATYYRYYPTEVAGYAGAGIGGDLSKEVDDSARAHLHSVAEELRREGVADVEEVLLRGNPAGAIVALAAETSDNLVAMTTHGRSGVSRWVMGSVADQVVRQSGDPVLLIHAKEEGSKWTSLAT